MSKSRDVLVGSIKLKSAEFGGPDAVRLFEEAAQLYLADATTSAKKSRNTLIRLGVKMKPRAKAKKTT